MISAGRICYMFKENDLVRHENQHFFIEEGGCPERQASVLPCEPLIGICTAEASTRASCWYLSPMLGPDPYPGTWTSHVLYLSLRTRPEYGPTPADQSSCLGAKSEHLLDMGIPSAHGDQTHRTAQITTDTETTETWPLGPLKTRVGKERARSQVWPTGQVSS